MSITRVVVLNFGGAGAEEVAGSESIQNLLAYMEECATDWFEDWQEEFMLRHCVGTDQHDSHLMFVHRESGVEITLGAS